MNEQQSAFWDIIEVFNKEGLLPYVMLIGSWAEYIYQYYFQSDFRPNLRTRDVDYLYINLKKPQESMVGLFDKMREKEFIYVEDALSGIGKFVKEDLLELEFITRVFGKGQSTNMIPSLNIKAEGLREVNMLADYPLTLECNEYMITVPEPEAYILQKLFANPTRKPEFKKEKDIQAIRELLPHINKSRIRQLLDNLSRKEQQTINTVCTKYFIEL